MPDFLPRIVSATQRRVAASAARTTLDALRRRAETHREPRGFAAALATPGVRVMAEIKRASPSRGDIRADLDPADLARAYEAGGAAALSVLTEPDFFKGSADDLTAARQATRLPVLRKDFLLDEYQVYESAAMGADAILLIVRILTDERLSALNRLAHDLRMDVLVEVHDEDDARRARRLDARLVAINNRDLVRFDTDVTRAPRLAAAFPPHTMLVAASGVAGADDVQRGLAAGITRFLVGEALVRAADPAALLRSWRAAGASP